MLITLALHGHCTSITAMMSAIIVTLTIVCDWYEADSDLIFFINEANKLGIKLVKSIYLVYT